MGFDSVGFTPKSEELDSADGLGMPFAFVAIFDLLVPSPNTSLVDIIFPKSGALFPSNLLSRRS